jgi:hypothetical protein
MTLEWSLDLFCLTRKKACSLAKFCANLCSTENQGICKKTWKQLKFPAWNYYAKLSHTAVQSIQILVSWNITDFNGEWVSKDMHIYSMPSKVPESHFKILRQGINHS